MEKIMEKMEKKKKGIFYKNETMEDRYDRKNNIFDFVKIILALFVVLSHCYALFEGRLIDPAQKYFLKTETLGGVAVIGFLIISGFMCAQSMNYSKNGKEFFMKRVIRIFPPLIIMLMITIFIIGPLGYEGDKSNYFNKSVFSYFFKNINLTGNTEYRIPGVFENNIYPKAINGSLWSLKHEFAAYIVLIVMSILLFLKKRKRTLLLTLIIIIIYSFNLKIIISVPILRRIFGVIGEFSLFIKLEMFFLIGVLFYLYRDIIQINLNYFIIAFCILIVGCLIGASKYVLIITIPYIIMYIGTIKINKGNYLVKKIGDFSYEMYIYSFPIQQLLYFYLKDSITLCTYMILSIVIIVCVSILATLLIDNNLKRIKKKMYN